MADKTKLPAYPTGIYAIADHVAALIDSYAAYANAVNEYGVRLARIGNLSHSSGQLLRVQFLPLHQIHKDVSVADRQH